MMALCLRRRGGVPQSNVLSNRTVAGAFAIR